jgi:hypothetical protein
MEDDHLTVGAADPGWRFALRVLGYGLSVVAVLVAVALLIWAGIWLVEVL